MDKKRNAEQPQEIRINKYLSSAGVCSRRDADRYTDAGRVTIDGRVVATGERISPDAQVRVDGVPIHREDKQVLLLFYKPRGVVCSTKKQRNEITVTEYLDYPVRIYPVGRLDKDSEGLLLLTNQGDLVNRIMRAGNYHEKEYLVTLNKEVTADFIRGMSGGVPILDTVTRKCKVEKTGKYTFRIILTQGLNRQIRRMCTYFGCEVEALKRVRIMNLSLDGLAPGAYRELTALEREELERRLKDSSSETVKNNAQSGGNSRENTFIRKKHARLGGNSQESTFMRQKHAQTGGNSQESTFMRKKHARLGGNYEHKSSGYERSGTKAKRSGKGVLSGGPGDHEQPGVRRAVRHPGAHGGGNRNRSGGQPHGQRRV